MELMATNNIKLHSQDLSSHTVHARTYKLDTSKSASASYIILNGPFIRSLLVVSDSSLVELSTAEILMLTLLICGSSFPTSVLLTRHRIDSLD